MPALQTVLGSNVLLYKYITFPSNFQSQSKVDFGHIMIKNMLFAEFLSKLIATPACNVYSYKNNPNHIEMMIMSKEILSKSV